MKVRIEDQPMSFQVNVWFYDSTPDGATIYTPDGAVQETLKPSEGAGDPSLVIGRNALEALVAAGSDFLPPSGAVERHLKDATQIRDRLLTIVEAKV